MAHILMAAAPSLLVIISSCSAAAAAAATQQPRQLPTAVASVNVTGAASPFPHYWKRCFGSGHALLGTRVDWRAHLQRARDELGLAGVRFHGVLDDDMSVTPDGRSYYFYNVDVVFDNLVALGITPIVELSFLPRALAHCTPSDCSYAFNDPGSYKGVQGIPRDQNGAPDYGAWYNLVHAFAAHLVERHGLAAIAEWHFEVWNEMWGVQFPSEYMPLYNASARALKAVDASLRVGGPATMQTQHLGAFVDACARGRVPVDFVSSHLYPSDPNCTTAREGARDPDCFAHTIARAAGFVRDAAARNGLAPLPFLVTEYKDGLQGGPGYGGGGPHGDTGYAAAFITRTVPMLDGAGADVLSWWTFTDVFEENWLRGVPFYGGFGLLTSQGVAKPAYRAFQLLAGAGAARVAARVADPLPPPAGATAEDYSTVSVLATVADGNGGGGGCARGLQVFLANFAPMAGATGAAWTPVARNVSLRLGGLSSTALRFVLTRVDDTATDPYAQWEAMGKPQYLTEAQLATLHAASEPAASVVDVPADGALALTLPPYGVAHLKVISCG